MAEPSANLNRQQHDNDLSSSITIKYDGLNIHAVEFVPSRFSNCTIVPTTSTNMCARNTPDDEKKQQGTKNKATDLNDQQVTIERSIITTVEISDNIKTNKAGAVFQFASQKEIRDAIVKRDIVRKLEPIDILFCDHIDTGKSTICGQVMYLTGQVDQRTLEKYQNEAQQFWYLSWLLDKNEEVRKQRIVDCHQVWFEIERKHCTILPQINYRYWSSGANRTLPQADIGIL
ncbi:unnamed protein product, partial [Rotaria sp. Silwood2]